tara:strand:+ start:1988 stop:2173 length:186 start_codon:yes stop_codon:yes gene_type:complete
MKKGDIAILFAYERHGEFTVDRVFKNKDDETCFTGKFARSGKKYELALHSKDRIVKESEVN